MLPTVGIVGGGQLARMLLPAAARLALPVRVLCREHDAVRDLTPDVVVGEPDADGLRRLAAVSDVVTVEHELVDLATMSALEREGVAVRPTASTLEIATDKVRQREVLGAAGVPLPPFRETSELSEVTAFADQHGWPLVLKRPRGGYDGRGVFVVDGPAAAAAVLAEVAGPVLVEPRLPLEHELAVLVARRPGGDLVVYDPVETVQEDAMCREVLLPAPLDAAHAVRAREVGVAVAEAVGAVGILAVELFVSDGEVLLNELASRPHNAGHVTIEGATTSQFENHLRAVADLPLGDPSARGPAVMVNVVGRAEDPRDRLPLALAHADASVHLYGKAHRRGRKLGHVTATGTDVAEAAARARRCATALMGEEGT